MTWKIIRGEDKRFVQKICNECNKLIETLDENNAIAKTLLESKGYDEHTTDFSDLDFGISPYHWCSLNCVSGMPKSNNIMMDELPFRIGMTPEDIKNNNIELANFINDTQTDNSVPKEYKIPGEEPLFPILQPKNMGHVPYTDKQTAEKYGFTKQKRGSKGRPPSTAMRIIKALEEQTQQNNRDNV